MKNCKNHHSCFCTIIPPFVVDELKKNGIETPKMNVLDKGFRARRNEKIKAMDSDRGLATPTIGQANRLVFDSQNKTIQRLKLVRGENNPPTSDSVVNKVYDNAGRVREYFQNFLNWLSYDNFGSNLVLNVHFHKDFNNAFWDGDEMTFGDGDGVIFRNLGNSIDVTAHELTHGVVQYTANLAYKSQSGALNEHFADVFGSVIKQYVKNQNASNADWLIGDEIMGQQLQGQALRSMKAPGTAYNNQFMGQDPQPAHMNNYYSGAADNYGVHINSGIPNKVFYLVATGINDTNKAGNLWFETLKKLKPNSTFRGFRSALRNQTNKLVNSGKLPSNTLSIVNNALSSVGL